MHNRNDESKNEQKAELSQNTKIKDALAIFSLKPDYTKSELETAYKNASLKNHPDKNKTPEAAVIFAKLIPARTTLLAHLVQSAENKTPIQQWLDTRQKLLTQKKAYLESIESIERGIQNAPETIKALHLNLAQCKAELAAAESKLSDAKTAQEKLTMSNRVDCRFREAEYKNALDTVEKDLQSFQAENERLIVKTFQDKYKPLREKASLWKKFKSNGFVEKHKAKPPSSFIIAIQARAQEKPKGTTATAWHATLAEWKNPGKAEAKRIAETEQKKTQLTRDYDVGQAFAAQQYETHVKAIGLDKLKNDVEHLENKTRGIRQELRKANVDYLQSLMTKLKKELDDCLLAIKQLEKQLAEAGYVETPQKNIVDEFEADSIAKAYQRIKTALETGNTHIKPSDDKQISVVETPQELFKQLQSGRALATETADLAWKLAKQHHRNCTGGNKELFKQIYAYVYRVDPSFFKLSFMTGKMLFSSQSVAREVQTQDIDPITKAHEKPNSRTGRIVTALSR